RQQMVLDLVADQLQIQVSNNELLDYLVNASRQYNMEPQAFIETVEKAGQLPAMVAEVSRSKAIAVALRRAAVKDTTGADVDLTPVIGRESDEAGVDVADAAETESSGA
ncbi:MAG TPA: trigger factor, partial [Coriobacteriia bacterium]